MGKLVGSVVKLSKQKLIVATVLDVLGDLCSVQMSARGKAIHGVRYIGPKPSVGDTVYVDYASGAPIIRTTSENLEEQIAEVQRTLSAAPTTLTVVPPSAPETPLSHVTDWIITEDGAAVTVVGPVEVRFPAGTLTDLGDGVVEYTPNTVRRFYASDAPTATDDETLGYVGTDVWLDEVADEVYICIDPAEDAAVWLNIGSGGSGTSFEPVTEEVEKELVTC